MQSKSYICEICKATQTKNGKPFTPQTFGAHKKTCVTPIIIEEEKIEIQAIYPSALRETISMEAEEEKIEIASVSTYPFRETISMEVEEQT